MPVFNGHTPPMQSSFLRIPACARIDPARRAFEIYPPAMGIAANGNDHRASSLLKNWTTRMHNSLRWILLSAMAVGAPMLAHAEEKNGIHLSVSKTTLDRADTRST